MTTYCYELTGTTEWQQAPDDAWETVIHSFTGNEASLGIRRIDDALCEVYQCHDGKIRAYLYRRML